MNAAEIRARFLRFFEKRGHAIIPSSPLVPENDPSVLFNTAGMQPLAPYLLGKAHPKGNRLADSQKCVRTVDIDEIGDNTHATFFEMLGNWSLGDPDAPDGVGVGYFKEDAIKWSYEFLTSKEEGLGLDPSRLYVTVFEGDENAPRDEESLAIWQKIFNDAGVSGERIYFMSAKSNWWSPGDNGPCGPDTEMFYDVTGTLTNGMTKEEYMAADDRQDVVEIWNDVFMEYEKKDGKVIGKLAQKNVDTGSGLERVTMVVQGKNNIFDTDLLAPLMERIKIQSKPEKHDLRAARIVADHIRTAVFLVSDGVHSANTDQGYILRRLLRRAVRYADVLGMAHNTLAELVLVVAQKYEGAYDNVGAQMTIITEEIKKEEEKFRKTLGQGMAALKKIFGRAIGGVDPENLPRGMIVRGNTTRVDGREVFNIYQTYGLPIEISQEIMTGWGLSFDDQTMEEAHKAMTEHQSLSRSGAEQKFKGGLADTSEKTTMLHTCTHLMLAGLRKYLGDHVHQAGSNITQERTRFDFTHPEKVPREVLDKVEEYVNEAISKKCPVVIEQMKKEEAQAQGVEGSFWEKYPDVVDVYRVKCDDGVVYSSELCGGPHVVNTSDIKGRFRITKEEASSSGIRRIKAVIE